MEIRPEEFIHELTQRTIRNYDYIKETHKENKLFEVTQLINSMYALLVVPEEIFGYKRGTINPAEFETKEKNLKKYPPYHKITDMIEELVKQNRLKYQTLEEYNQNSPVSCLLYNMRNALCHDDIGFWPITTPEGKSAITDVIFRDGKGKKVKFMLVIKVEQLEKLLRSVAQFYSDVEKGKANADKAKYIQYYMSFENDLRQFIGSYDE